MLQKFDGAAIKESLKCLNKRLEHLWRHVDIVVRLLIVELSILGSIVIHLNHGFSERFQVFKGCDCSA